MHPLAGERRARHDPRPHGVHHVEHLLLAGVRVLGDAVQRQRLRRAAAALVEGGDEPVAVLDLLQHVGVHQISPSSLTASRSSTSSAAEASILPRLKSSMSRPWTIEYAPSGARHREAGDDALGHAVAAVARDAHRHPVAVRRAERPRADVVDGGVGRRRRRRRATGLDDRRAALGDGRDERAVDPVVVADGLVGVACRRPRSGTGRGTASSSGCPRSSSSCTSVTGAPSFWAIWRDRPGCGRGGSSP